MLTANLLFWCNVTPSQSIELHQGLTWPFVFTGLARSGEGKEETTKNHLFCCYNYF